MAKILLVAQKLSPTALGLARSLKSSPHQVTLLTGEDSSAQAPEGIETLSYFRSWSWLEALRLLPHFYSLNPQIVHFVLDEDRLNPAQIVLALATKGLSQTVLTTSVLQIRRGLRRRNPVRSLLQESDIVTCPSVEALGSLRGLNVKTLRQGRGILPPVLDFSENPPHEVGSDYLELQKALLLRRPLVVPFLEPQLDPSKPAFRRLMLMAAHRPLVLMGSTADWKPRDRKKLARWFHERGLGSQWTLTGPLNAAEKHDLLSKSEALILAGQHLSPLELTEYFVRALSSGCTVVLDEKQAQLHSSLWRDEETCWILRHDDLNTHLQDLLCRENLRLTAKVEQSDSLGRDLVDAPLNELNRLYNKALSHKHVLG